MPRSSFSLSVVVPVYNEADTVIIILQKLLRCRSVSEIIVVDDGSQDETPKLLRDFVRRHHKRRTPRLHCIRQANSGKGAALRAGFQHVTGTHVLIQDADLEYDPDDIPQLVRPILDGKAVVVYGSRFLGPHTALLFWHLVGNHLINFLTNILYNTTLSDLETCYKIIPTPLLAELRLQSTGFEIEPEITCKLLARGVKIYEVPISYTGRDFSEGKKITWRDGLIAFGLIWSFRCQTWWQSWQQSQPLTRFLSSWLFPIVTVFASVFARYWPAIVGGKAFFFGDNFSLFVPQRLFLIEALRQGEVPLWNPYIMNGVPYFANISKAVLYPFTYLFAVMSPAVALNTLLLGHLIWGGLGIVYCARRWRLTPWQAALAATLWMFSAPITAPLNNLVLTQTIAWLPWIVGVSFAVFWQNERKLLPILIVLSVLQVFAGHPQPVVYTWLLAGVMSSFAVIRQPNQRLFPLVLWGTGTLLGAAAILLPLWDFSQLTTRLHLTATEALAGSLRPQHLASFILPHFWSDPLRGSAWGPDWGGQRENGGYITLFGMVVIAFQLRKLWRDRPLTKFFLLAAAISIVCSLGQSFPPFVWMYTTIPALTMLRTPSQWLIIWSFIAAFLIPMALVSFHPSRKLLLIMTLLAFGMTLTGAVVGLNFTAVWPLLPTTPFHTFDRDTVLFSTILFDIFVGGGVTLAAFWFWREAQERNDVRLRLVVILILTAELAFQLRGVVPLAPQKIYSTPSPVAVALRQRLTPQDRFASSVGHFPWTGLPSYWENMTIRPPFQDSRFTASEGATYQELQHRRELLATDWGMPARLPTSYGYGTFVMRAMADAYDLGHPGPSINQLDSRDFTDPQLTTFGNRYLVVDKTVFSPEEWQRIMRPFHLIEDHPTWALYENPQALPIIRGPGVQVERIDRRVNELKFVASASQAATLTVAETYAPEWRAWLDWQPVALTEQDGMRQLTLPSGKHQVEMKYQSRAVMIGLWLSGLGGGSLLLIAFWWSRLAAHSKGA